MRKAAFVVVAAAAASMALVGCGSKECVKGVPETVATVNGEKISSSQYLEQTSRRAGQQVLQNMLDQAVVLEWAKSEGVSPTDEQIKKQIEILTREGIYAQQVKIMGEEGIKTELTSMQARINLAKKLLKITDADLQQAYDQMKSRYVHGPRKQVALIINPDRSKIEAAEKAIKDGKTFDEAATEFTDSRFGPSGPITIWIDETQKGLPADLVTAAKETKVNEVSKIFTIGQPGMPSQNGIMKVLQEQPKADQKLADVKPEVEDTAAMQKSQMDPDFQKKLNERKKDAKIEINIAEFKSIAQSFKNPPEPSPMMMSPQQRPAPKSAPAPAPKSAPAPAPAPKK